jgi:hypothetical protein
MNMKSALILVLWLVYMTNSGRVAKKKGKIGVSRMSRVPFWIFNEETDFRNCWDHHLLRPRHHHDETLLYSLGSTTTICTHE